MIKTAEQLKQQAAVKGINFYPVHDCSLCGYQCGFLINGENVAYDSGCDCTGRQVVTTRDWNYLANVYNTNQPENNPRIKQSFLDELDKTWQFGNVAALTEGDGVAA